MDQDVIIELSSKRQKFSWLFFESLTIKFLPPTFWQFIVARLLAPSVVTVTGFGFDCDTRYAMQSGFEDLKQFSVSSNFS